MHADVLIVGAGAAGLIAAWRTAARGLKVIVLEKSPKIGVKILMSGGTRCNVTQDTDATGIMKAFGKNGQFLRQALQAFGPQDVREVLAGLGVATKVEVTGKVFPASDSAVDVRDALWKQAVNAGADFRVGTAVQSIKRSGEQWHAMTDAGTFAAPQMIMCVGGRSYPGCGTRGDGYPWMEELGHRVVPTRPALVPLIGGFDWTRNLSGMTLEDVSVSVMPATGKQKALDQRRGSLLFTHHGFSGPTAMDVSRTVTAAESFEDVKLALDVVPEQASPKLESWFAEQRQKAGTQLVAASLSSMIPRRFAEALMIASGATQETKFSQISAASMRQLIGNLKGLSLPVQGTRGYDKAEVTAGGVDLKEVDPRTMSSRLHAGLYLAGEILDLDGWIGGYNFQSAFCTGFVAGEACGDRHSSGQAT